MKNETLDFIQKEIDYQFANPKLLAQAFTRRSYAEEHQGEEDNEILEFYGDKALEFVVMKRMSEVFGCVDASGTYVSRKAEGQLTEIKKALVCQEMLAHRMGIFAFESFLRMGEGDKGQHVETQKSVKEDLLEAIVGAVALDSKFRLDVLEKVVEKLLDVNYYLQNCALNADEDEQIKRLRMIEAVGEPTLDRSINQLQELYQKKFFEQAEYTFVESHRENGNPFWYCECRVDGWVFYGEYSSKAQGKKEVSYLALKKLLG